MGLNLSPKMVVKEAMSSPVITVGEEEAVSAVAKLMRDNKIGAVVVTSPDSLPIGIITERDIVIRVVATGRSPDQVKVREVMSSPLRVVKADMDLIAAMRLMDKMGIRRLGVVYKGNLVGITSNRDMIRIMPTIVEIAREVSEINSSEYGGSPSTVGYCDHCEGYSTNLRSVSGEFLCEDCRVDEDEG